jgi:hypothetical protein
LLLDFEAAIGSRVNTFGRRVNLCLRLCLPFNHSFLGSRHGIVLDSISYRDVPVWSAGFSSKPCILGASLPGGEFAATGASAAIVVHEGDEESGTIKDKIF